MITPRQKTRLDAEAPVLFRLPNLHGASLPKTNQSRVNGVNLPGASERPVESSARTRVLPESPEIFMRIDAAAPSTPAPMSQSGENRRAETATVTVSSSTPPMAAAVRVAHGRSWMERVGSRLILLVTLMVIVTAAWVTGQRMPASKLDNWSDPALSQVTPVQGIVELPKFEPTALAGGLTESTKTNRGPEASAYGSRNQAIAPEASANGSRNQEPDAMVATLTAPPTSIPNSLQASTSVYKPIAETELPAIEEDVASIFNSVSLQGPQTDDAQSQGFYDAEPITLAPPATSNPADTNSDNQSPANATHGAMTKTPLEPTFDPNVLLPWLSEQTAALERRESTTPNPIDDWSQYLPDAQPNANLPVRAASATQSSAAGSSAHQAVYPPGVMTNPYSR